MARLSGYGRRCGAALTNEAISGIDTLAYGRVFTQGTGAGDSPAQQISVDRAVNIVDTELPGAVLTASDHYALFVCDGPDVDCSDYEIDDEEYDGAWYPYYAVHRIDG